MKTTSRHPQRTAALVFTTAALPLLTGCGAIVARVAPPSPDRHVRSLEWLLFDYHQSLDRHEAAAEARTVDDFVAAMSRTKRDAFADRATAEAFRARLAQINGRRDAERSRFSTALRCVDGLRHHDSTIGAWPGPGVAGLAGQLVHGLFGDRLVTPTPETQTTRSAAPLRTCRPNLQ